MYQKRFSFSLMLIFFLFVCACSTGDDVEKKQSHPILLGSTIEEITYNSATVTSEVVDKGHSEVLTRGVCWGINPYPTINDKTTINGDGKGSFSSAIEGLEPDTKYFARAYAQNSDGTGYGNPIEFTTQKQPIVSHGIILKTTDGGETWVEQKIDGILNLRSVIFISPSIGFAAGECGIVVRTIDGGKNWSVHYVGEGILYDVFFTDENTGYVVGNSSTISKTVDGGDTWIRQESGISYPLWSIYFTDSETGFVVGEEGVILKTENGGEKWDLNAQHYPTPLFSVLFNDAATGYAAGSDRFYSTKNGGESWELNRTPRMSVREMHAINSETFYATTGGIGGDIFKTTNAGSDWTKIATGLAWKLETIFFPSDKVGYVGGFGGAVFKTTDGGATWEKQITGTNRSIKSLYFTDEDTGFAVGNMK